MRALSLLLLLPARALAQAPVFSVSSAPAGSCTPSDDGRVQLVKSTGAIYCCNSGTWGSCGGSSNADTLDGLDTSNNSDSSATVVTRDANGRSAAKAWGVTAGLGDLTNDAPWYGIGQSNYPSDVGGGLTAVQVAGYYGILLKTGARSLFLPHGNVATQLTGDFVASGNITAYGSVSDLRLKRDVQPIAGALGKTLRLRGVTHGWREEKLDAAGFEPTRGTVHGLIAQEVQAVMPDAVYEAKGQDGETYLGVRYERVVPLLVEAIRELEARVAALEERRARGGSVEIRPHVEDVPLLLPVGPAGRLQ